jgi:hypothetical protein
LGARKLAKFGGRLVRGPGFTPARLCARSLSIFLYFRLWNVRPRPAIDSTAPSSKLGAVEIDTDMHDTTDRTRERSPPKSGVDLGWRAAQDGRSRLWG